MLIKVSMADSRVVAIVGFVVIVIGRSDNTFSIGKLIMKLEIGEE